ncbi:MAG: hypothetical protein M1828_004808 [Chrysothrix sp. TS-e1954]|nr:MAG: hypothetical protein M1828_004808 [Chrysothrix sp. TS-e1954]
MGFNPALLFKAPAINPVNQKARSIPFFNPINVYGRVFHFSWFGFFIAFWSWYAFPPLLNDVIKKDIHLTKKEISNSNIIALVATLLVRVVAGPACDKFGPRKTFATCLLLGAIPTFCAGGVTNATGLMVLRFFIGILGGSFVPCQVWTTGFYDKNVVGTANSLTAGFGNAGGGITYFVMPAIYNSLVNTQHESKHTAWRVAFVVPGILIVTVAVAMLLLCPDTPTGKWSERGNQVENNLRRHSMIGVVEIPGELSEKPLAGSTSGTESPSSTEKKDILPPAHIDPANFGDNEAQLSADQMMDTAKGEVVRKPTWSEIRHVLASPQTFVTVACYFCSFGTELSVNSILGTYYQTNNKLTLQKAGDWAAMFGMLNFVFRPIGGFSADFAYRTTGSVWGKKVLLHTYAFICGAFLIIIGQLNPKDLSTLVGLIAGMAFFLEAGNGVNYALVPHVHPHANGIISGLTGAAGNLGGIVFSIIFRYEVMGKKTLFAKSFWIIGVITIVLNALVAWIPPVPRKQIGGR